MCLVEANDVPWSSTSQTQLGVRSEVRLTPKAGYACIQKMIREEAGKEKRLLAKINSIIKIYF